MCVAFIAWRVHPAYPLLLAGNRDELYARPSLPIGPWPERRGVIGGRDLVDGGSWLAARHDGRVALVTNYRQAPLRRGRRSRGALVANAVLDDRPVDELFADVVREGPEYGGFHLLVADHEHLRHVSNREPGVRVLPPGFHGISNGPHDTIWPKMRRGLDALPALVRGERPDVDGIFALLADAQRAPDDELPDTGVGLELERALSPIFLASAAYGTRASTVILVGQHDVTVYERRFDADGPTGASQSIMPIIAS